MREIGEIIKAFNRACQENKLTALATVVKVEGSAYRRPGARMLITEDGRLTGAISGGCLEGDALKKALLVMHQKKATLVKYDTTEDDDVKLGVGLGCKGIIHILIEPLYVESLNPVHLLEKLLQKRQYGVLVTLYNEEERHKTQLGTTLFATEDELIHFAPPPPAIQNKLVEDAKDSLKVQRSCIKSYIDEISQTRLTAFIEVIQPRLVLNVIGAGNDVIPLVDMAAILGWEVNVIDGRANLLTRDRFPSAFRLINSRSEQILSHIATDSQTVFALLSHNYTYDLNVLKALLPLNIPYVGVLGPKKKLDRMLQELKEQGLEYSAEQLAKVYGPAGLDISAETSEEIALSILSEIKAVLSKKNGTFLKDKAGPIHEDRVINATEKDSKYNSSYLTCSITWA